MSVNMTTIKQRGMERPWFDYIIDYGLIDVRTKPISVSIVGSIGEDDVSRDPQIVLKRVITLWQVISIIVFIIFTHWKPLL